MQNDTGKHYRFEYKGIKLDPARICQIYNITNICQATIIKKVLLAGKRGKKSFDEDLDDVLTALERWREMSKEDEIL